MATNINIDWVCFCNKSGYAQASLDYLQCLKMLNYDVKVTLLHSEPDKLSLSTSKYIEFTSLMHKPRKDDSIQILHCVPDMQKRVPKAKLSIGFGTFETFTPPAGWIEILNKNDAVICPSNFNVKVFRDAGVKKPIFYIPHCYDINLYNEKIVPLDTNADGRFVFMFIGSWKKRKGYIQLLEAWMQEFDHKDPVKLIIKTDRYTMANKTIQDIRINLGLQKKEIAPILLEGRVFNEVDLPRFIKTANCLVAPSLGEGFGIPPLQSMAMGIPIIVTNFSGVTDYANNNNATLIEPHGFILYNELDTIPQFKNCKWAHITTESVRKAMRHVIDNPVEIQNKAKQGLVDVINKFTYEKVVPKFKSMIEQMQ